MNYFSLILRIIFYLSFLFMGVDFALHILDIEHKFLANVGVIILLFSPVVSSVFSAIWFAINKKFKLSFFSFLLLLVLVFNMILS